MSHLFPLICPKCSKQWMMSKSMLPICPDCECELAPPKTDTCERGEMKTPGDWLLSLELHVDGLRHDDIIAIQSDATADAEARLKEALWIIKGTGSTETVESMGEWIARRDAWLEREAKRKQ